MYIKLASFLIISFYLTNSLAQKATKKNKETKENKVSISDSSKLYEIWEISKKLDSLVIPQFSTNTTKIDKAKIDSLNKLLIDHSAEITELKDKIATLNKELEAKNKSIEDLEGNEKKVIESQQTLISNLNKSSKIDNKTILELYLKSLESQPTPSNISELKEFQSLSNLLDACDEMLTVDFSKLSSVKQRLEELKSKEKNIQSYPGLSLKYKRISLLMIGYEKKIVDLNDHLHRYYVTYRNANSSVEDRIMYLQDNAKDFKDYPYLLKLIFEAIVDPDNNPLKSEKLK